MEVRPLPLGVTSLPSLTSSGTVATTLTVNGVMDTTATGKTLTPGMNYYANTKGDFISGQVYAGRGSSQTSDGVEYDYIYDETHNALIMTNSKIGLATTPYNLYVQKQT